MKTRTLLTGAFLLVAILTQGAMALARSGESSVIVLAHGPAGLRIEGKSSDVSLEEDASGLTFKVPLAPIETGIGLRNRHLREMLEAEKFPIAILRVARGDLIFPREHQPAEGTAKGELTLHGQSRAVEVYYHAETGAGGITQVRGSLQLDIREFEIKSPSYLGVTVAPEVEVKVALAVEGV
jgi:polyisoprenoid-binding protein YceI